jgi:hypothetical protein
VDLEDLGLDERELAGGSRPYACGAGLHLERALGDPGRPDQFRRCRQPPQERAVVSGARAARACPRRGEVIM